MRGVGGRVGSPRGSRQGKESWGQCWHSLAFGSGSRKPLENLAPPSQRRELPLLVLGPCWDALLPQPAISKHPVWSTGTDTPRIEPSKYLSQWGKGEGDAAGKMRIKRRLRFRDRMANAAGLSLCSSIKSLFQDSSVSFGHTNLWPREFSRTAPGTGQPPLCSPRNRDEPALLRQRLLPRPQREGERGQPLWIDHQVQPMP